MYKRLSEGEIRHRFPGYTKVFPDSGTASSFQGLPRNVLEKMDSLSGVKRSARAISSSGPGGSWGLSLAEQQLIDSGELPKTWVVEILGLHHPVR